MMPWFHRRAGRHQEGAPLPCRLQRTAEVAPIAGSSAGFPGLSIHSRSFDRLNKLQSAVRSWYCSMVLCVADVQMHTSGHDFTLVPRLTNAMGRFLNVTYTLKSFIIVPIQGWISKPKWCHQVSEVNIWFKPGL